MKRPIDMTGKVYGSLQAVASTGRRSRANNLIWKFSCACRVLCEMDGYTVRAGKLRECLECSRKKLGKWNATHGASSTAEFRIWVDIQTRCYNRNSTGFRNYGGRGISVCERWRESFEAFLADVGPRPSPQHSIDRIDNDGNYEPSNCRWVTRREQAFNRRTNVRVTIEGATKTITEWANQCGIAPSTMWARVTKYGWTGSDLLTPARKRR